MANYWSAEQTEKYGQYVAIQQLKEDARREHETILKELTEELFNGLYGQSWRRRPMQMWVIPTEEHFKLAESARIWALRASEEFAARLEFMLKYQGAFPSVRDHQRPYHGHVQRLNVLRTETSFAQERVMSHMMWWNADLYQEEEVTFFPRSYMADLQLLAASIAGAAPEGGRRRRWHASRNAR